MITLDRLEFYITNVCNLTCSGCNRYNNYKFRGTQTWSEAEPVLEQWAKFIDIKHPVILGGEPLLNPDIVQWMMGLRRLWPHWSGVQIQTNGTRIDRVPGLYEALEHGNWIGISIHNPLDRDAIFQAVHRFLKQPVRQTADPTHPVGSDYQFYDANNRYVHAWMSGKFVQSNIIELSHGRFGLYRSDPERAHENCTYRRFKNYHMINGKIYKCGPAALMPEFDQQYHFDISDSEREVLYGYQPLTVDSFETCGLEFFRDIDNMIPQCKFCPEHYEYKEISFTDLKKPWRD